MTYLLNGTPIKPGTAFSAVNSSGDLIQFPANWIECATEEERISIGLSWIEDPKPFDARFQDGWDQNGKPIWKNHSTLVNEWALLIKNKTKNLLSISDWMVIRQIDNGVPMPPQAQIARQTIRNQCAERCAAIEATTSTEELAAYVTSAAYGQW
jgi:hypothetical protein